jgi:2,4-diaminopentanoate dehydrogenase
MACVAYIEHNGTRHEVQVPDGSSVMQGAVNNMIDGIVAECGGALACATCHCYVDDAWIDRVGPPSEPELQMLECTLESLRINEFADVSSRNSPAMLFDVMGFGRPPPKAIQGRLDYLRHSFGPSLQLIADAISLPLDSLEVSGGVALARNDTKIAAGLIPAGTVGAQRTTVSGMRGGKALLSFTATWYAITDIDADWDLRDSGWHVVVDGDAPLDVSIRFPVAPENYADMTPGLTAHRPVNTIPYLCEAPPGIRTTVDLPQIIATLG